MSISDKTPTSLLEARSVSKTFGSKKVLDALDLDIRAGEVHGLLGQNGSGKSTFIKILSGFYEPDPGAEIRVGSRPLSLPLDPKAVREAGFSFVHQELALAGPMTVLENLRVARFETAPGWRIRWNRERRAVQQELDRFGLDHISPGTEISNLREVERATVAIVRAMNQLDPDAGAILVLDEPTVYLPRDGIERLFDAVRNVTAAGVGVLFVTHRIDEVRTLTDRVTVLRDGKRVLTDASSAVTDDEVLEAIVGAAVGKLYPPRHHPRQALAMSIRNLSSSQILPLNLDLHEGEVVGMTGLLGMGHERVPYHLFGAEHPEQGQLVLAGEQPIELSTLEPRVAIKAGIALLPANRLRDGCAATASVAENVTLPALSAFFRSGRLELSREADEVLAMLTDMQVRPAEPSFPMGGLSGGNQQKALIAKWLSLNPKVLLLDEPTQGVDVGARKEIFSRIRDLAESGGSVLISSTEYEDLANLCDRVLVFRDGAVRAELKRGELNEQRIVEECFSS